MILVFDVGGTGVKYGVSDEQGRFCLRDSFETPAAGLETFLDKIRHSIYGVRLSSQEKTLVNGKEKFIDLSVEAKCQVLYEILHLFQCQSGASNLKMIGGPASAGILVMNNNISKCKNISIVNQSPTGIYEKEIDLLRV